MEEKYNELKKFSNPTIVKKKAVEIFGKDVKLAVSTRKQNKYMILNPHTDKWVHFGGFNPPMEDYTKHRDRDSRPHPKDIVSGAWDRWCLRQVDDSLSQKHRLQRTPCYSS